MAPGRTSAVDRAEFPTIGLLLPWQIGRMGQDPAYGSGPLATIIQDVLSLAVYFLIAGVLLA
jgi:magnesium transporter